jgi:excisionase family DNA binding protein
MNQFSANSKGPPKDSLPDALGENLPRDDHATFSFEPLLDGELAAKFLGGIHPKTLQRMARSGEVPAYRVGRFWRYRASELNDWLRVKSNGRIARVVSIKEKP